MKRLKRERAVIGWREWVALPELGIDKIKVKIDTGARTSVIHAFEISPFEHNGQRYIRFSLHPVQHRRQPVVDCEAKVVDERTVTSSNGEREHRYVIETIVELGGDSWPIELTLSNRDEMGFRMLLGRAAVRKRFVIDPGGSFRLSGRTAGKKPPSKVKSPPKRKPRSKAKPQPKVSPI